MLVNGITRSALKNTLVSLQNWWQENKFNVVIDYNNLIKLWYIMFITKFVYFPPEGKLSGACFSTKTLVHRGWQNLSSPLCLPSI